MKANRPHRITFQKRTVAQDAGGHDINSWSNWFDEYAAIYYGTGTEQRVAAQETGAQSASFEVLSNSRTRIVTLADFRIVDRQGAAWDLTAYNDLGFNDGLRFTATRARP